MKRKSIFESMIIIPVIALIAVLLIVGCPGNGNNNTYPQVLYCYPDDGNTDIPINCIVTIIFDRAIDTDSVVDALVIQPDAPGNYNWSNGNTKLEYTPSDYLQPNTKYTVIITTLAKDSEGNPLQESYTWSFTTGEGADTTGPWVESVNPDNAAPDVQINTNVSITFSEPMNTTSTENAFLLSDGSMPPVNGTFSWNGNTMTFDPDNDLAYDTQYYVTVDTGARDASNNPMLSDSNSSFRTIEEHPVVPVQGGVYPMGYDDVFEEEHDVTLSSFSMGIYEVTNAQVVDVFNWANGQSKFQTVTSLTVTNVGNSQELLDLDDPHCNIQYSGGTFSARTDLGDDGSGGTVDVSNYPCAEITWYGAAAFCNYLSEIEGLTPCYSLSNWSCNFSANGYRLATEAEWEYAARYIDGEYNNFRAGYSFSGSDTADDVAWYIDNSSETPHNDIADGYGTHEVGLKDPNELNIYDMSGNVNEWCHDWSNDAPYPSTSQTNPTGPSSGTYRIIRGGGFGGTTDEGLRTSHRWHAVPYESMNDVGLRVVKRP